MAIAETAELAVRLSLDDRFSRAIRGIEGRLGKLNNRLGQAGRTIAHTAAVTATTLASVGGALTIGAIKVAADFEAQLNTINTVASTTPEKLDAIGASIRKIARDSGASLEDLTQGFYDLVSAGIAADQATRVLQASNTLAVGGLATTAETVDLLTTALNSYGVAAEDAGATSEQFADIFAKAIERGKVTAADLAASFAQIGPIAAQSGIEIEELAAGYAELTAQGVPASEAAVKMRSALVGLLSPNEKLNALQRKLGVNFARLAKEKGLVPALNRLRVEAEKAGIPLIDLIGRVEGYQFALATTGDNLDDYRESLAAVQEADGTAARQMGERQKGLNFQLARLGALARDAGITIGSKLLPKLTPLVERAVSFIATHEKDIERLGDSLAGAFEGAVQWASRIPWGQIAEGLRTAAEFAGRVISAFASAPPEVQATLLALAGLNKLSGGLVGDFVGEIGKGLIRGVLGISAAVVNITAGSVTGGGLPGVGGKGAGGAKGLLSGAARIILPAAAIAAAVEVSGVLDPRHQTSTGQVFRGTNVPSEQIANLQRAIDRLRERIAGGERGIVERQLAETEAALARLQAGLRPPLDQIVASSRQAYVAQQTASARTVDGLLALLGSSRAEIAATRASGQQAAAAIRDKKLSTTVNVTTSTQVTVRDMVSRTRTSARYGQLVAV